MVYNHPFETVSVLMNCEGPMSGVHIPCEREGKFFPLNIITSWKIHIIETALVVDHWNSDV
jgi:hypothetical protein